MRSLLSECTTLQEIGAQALQGFQAAPQDPLAPPS